MLSLEELKIKSYDKEQENLIFRNYMENNYNKKDVMAHFNQLCNEQTKKYECDQCRNCCKEIGIDFNNEQMSIADKIKQISNLTPIIYFANFCPVVFEVLEILKLEYQFDYNQEMRRFDVKEYLNDILSTHNEALENKRFYAKHTRPQIQLEKLNENGIDINKKSIVEMYLKYKYIDVVFENIVYDYFEEVRKIDSAIFNPISVYSIIPVIIDAVENSLDVLMLNDPVFIQKDLLALIEEIDDYNLLLNRFIKVIDRLIAFVKDTKKKYIEDDISELMKKVLEKITELIPSINDINLIEDKIIEFYDNAYTNFTTDVEYYIFAEILTMYALHGYNDQTKVFEKNLLYIYTDYQLRLYLKIIKGLVLSKNMVDIKKIYDLSLDVDAINEDEQVAKEEIKRIYCEL